jgi:hypothetical protein
VKLCESLPPQESSPFAEEGTAAHELAEACLIDERDAISYLGEEFNGFRVTEEMADAVQVYVDTVNGYATEGTVLEVEKRFDLSWLYEGMFGTNDACVLEPFGTLTIIDYKHGAGIAVEAKDNPQLMYYALGAARDEDFTDVRMVIVQPRANHVDGPVRVHTITIAELGEFAEKLYDAAIRTEDDDAGFKAGKHCRFCTALPTCGEARKTALETAAQKFDVVAEDKEVVLPAPEDLTPKQMARVLDASTFIRDWANSVEAHALRAMRNGVTIPEYKLVQKRSNRRWKDEKEVFTSLASHGEEIYQPRKIKSPAQMEKVVGKEVVADLTEKPDAGVKIARITSKAPAVKSVIDHFEVVG